jgi:transcriptional regulator with PAS, ATPase and Fis domain
MRAAERTLASGLASIPDEAAVGCEGAWPVRYGGEIIGALWCRWSSGLSVLPADADALMGVAAAAAAPMVHAACERGRAAAESPEIPDLVGESEVMREVRAALLRAARSPFPVLIEGESGSGKELVARAIHRASPRRDRRFSALNCAALSEELAEAELFGHAKGAFTGAVTERAGLFEEANGGTLFLDEVSELSSRIQAKLLRVLQEHEVRRIGEAHVRRIDVRIVAATNRPLAGEVEAGRFRRDLRYRLDVVRLTIPPLRDRLEDIPALVRHVWAALCEKTGSRAVLSAAAMAALGRYDWPGNVRELQNVLASVIVTSPPRGPLPVSQLPAHVARTVALSDCRTLADARRDFESRFVRAALARAGGRHGVAARELGVSRQGLTKVLARLGLAYDSGGHGSHV